MLSFVLSDFNFMDYSFNTVKNLFDTFNLVLNEKREFIAV